MHKWLSPFKGYFFCVAGTIVQYWSAMLVNFIEDRGKAVPFPERFDDNDSASENKVVRKEEVEDQEG